DAELAEQLHAAGIMDVALGMPARLGFAVEQRRAHAVHVEVQREREPDRPAAHDGDLGRLLFPRHRRAPLNAIASGLNSRGRKCSSSTCAGAAWLSHRARTATASVPPSSL